MKKNTNSLLSSVALSMFYIGRSPISPGTLASLVSLPIIYLLYSSIHVLLFIFILVITYFLAEILIRKFVEKPFDKSWIVIDEFIGMSITLLPLFFLHSFSITYTIVAFILFRIFDILKPFYIRSIDSMETSFSVLQDDVLAGIYSAIVLYIITLIL